MTLISSTFGNTDVLFMFRIRSIAFLLSLARTWCPLTHPCIKWPSSFSTYYAYVCPNQIHGPLNNELVAINYICYNFDASFVCKKKTSTCSPREKQSSFQYFFHHSTFFYRLLSQHNSETPITSPNNVSGWALNIYITFALKNVGITIFSRKNNNINTKKKMTVEFILFQTIDI